MLADTDETIVAIASSHDVGGPRGIVRISGLGTVELIQRFFQPSGDRKLKEVRAATRIEGSIRMANWGPVPCDLMLWPSRRSYTQQPTAELHTMGALPLLNRLVNLACEHGARLARPGEFTLRSFLSGRLDLAQAEAVLGVIDATNDREMHVALTQLAGGLSKPLTQLRDVILNLVADLEAGLDFVDEDIEFISQDRVLAELASGSDIIDATLKKIQTRSIGGQLPRVVLRGEPNVGKSSIWNALVDDGNAIVNATAGTTRDYLVGNVQTAEGHFQLVDTAGMESADDGLRGSMRLRSDQQAEQADLVLLCIDATRPRTPWEEDVLSTKDDATIVVMTKCDLANVRPSDAVAVSADRCVHHQDEVSLKQLASLCGKRLLAAQRGGTQESSVVTNTATRCRESLRLAKECVDRAQGLVRLSAGDELVVSELRTALDELGQVVGVVYNDDVLDRIFSRFCIGK